MFQNGRNIFNWLFMLLLFFSFLPIIKGQSDFPALKQQFIEYRKSNQQDSALIIARKMNNQVDSLYSDSIGLIAEVNTYLGKVFYSFGEYDSSFFYHSVASNTLKNSGEINSIQFINSLSMLGYCYMKRGLYEKAAIEFEECLTKRYLFYGGVYSKYVKDLDNTSWCYFMSRNYLKAIHFNGVKLEYILNTQGTNSYDYINALQNSALIYRDQGFLNKADSVYDITLLCLDKIDQLDSNYYYSTIISIAEFKLMADLGFDAIENLNLVKSFVSSDSYLNCKYKNTLGLAYNSIGKFQEAIDVFNELLKNEDDLVCIDKYSVYSNIGVSYYSVRQLELAEKYYLKGFVGPMHHEDSAYCYYNLAMIYQAKTDYTKALSYYKNSIGVTRNGIMQARIYKEIGQIYMDNYEFDKSKVAIDSSIVFYEKFGFGNSVIKADILTSKAEYFYYKENYDSCEILLNKAKILYEENSLNHFENYSNVLFHLANTKVKLSKNKEALNIYDFLLRNIYSNINYNFFWLSAIERNNYWEMQGDFFDKIRSCSVLEQGENFQFEQIVYNSSLISKSLLLETIRELDFAIAQKEDTVIQQNFHDLKIYRRQVSKLESEGSANKELLDKLRAKADSLDKKLVNEVGEFAEAKKKFSTTWQDVQKGLRDNEAAIEFARYEDDEDSTTKYMAMLVRPGYEYPQVVKLGNEYEIKKVNAKYHPEDYYKSIWQPIEHYLEEVETIYYSPVGELNNVPFHVIYDKTKDGRTYLMDKYDLHQITSTRYLADNKKEKEYKNSIALFGGVSYDFVPDEKKEKTEEWIATRGNDKSMLKTTKWNYLAGTENEVNKIADYLNKNWQVKTYTGIEAVEDAFYNIDGEAPRIIHVATHGFAYDHAIKYDSTITHFAYNKYPMARTGLIMAGGNWTWGGNDTLEYMGLEHDGVLTASEISNMDLSNTELAVLSACNTAKGQIQDDEGTFGLKRAFKLAGVEYILVSLWKVPDIQTSELMQLFYQNIEEGKPIQIAFREAQLSMRKKYPSKPNLWAGFVLVK